MVDVEPCPYCSHDDARRVKFTAWGGWIGAQLMSVVVCGACARQYNGRSGRKVEKAIRVYRWAMLVVLAVIAAGAIYYSTGARAAHFPGRAPVAAPQTM